MDYLVFLTMEGIILKKIIVDDVDNIRLDTYISANDNDLSRERVKKLMDDGNILVNGTVKKNSYKVKSGDVIEIDMPELKDTKIEAQDIPIEVVYEDDDIIVVNKPKGIVVHPANGNHDGTLVNAIMNICKSSLSGIGGEIRPGIVHRLDKDTSGLLIVAKNDKAHISMSQQIKDRKVNKRYIALVRGIIGEDEATINMPIARSKKDRKKMAVDKDGREAITHFKVIKRYDKYTLLDIKIDTGRTHQIRVHMSEIGHPVIGDEVYSNGKNEFGVKGQMLHARSLDFVHPITGKKMHLEADLPQYFKDVLDICDKRLEAI